MKSKWETGGWWLGIRMQKMKQSCEWTLGFDWLLLIFSCGAKLAYELLIDQPLQNLWSKTSHARVERPFEVNILQGQAVGSLDVNLLSDLYWEDHHSQPQFHTLVMAGRWLPGWWYSLSISIKPPILKPTDSPRGPVPNCAIYPHPSHPIHTFTPPQFLAQEITAENNQEIGCVCEKRRYKESKICWMLMVDGFFVIFVEPQQKTTHATGRNIWTKTGFTVQAFGRSFEKCHGWDLSFPLYFAFFVVFWWVMQSICLLFLPRL